MPQTPYPKNAPGPFYVEDQCCITCAAPYHEAPDLMEHDKEGGYPHCYFKKQPETPEEVEQAVMACVVSCVRAVRYAGDDPAILRRFREERSSDSCDAITKSEPQVTPEPPPPMTWEEPRPPIPPLADRFHPLWDRDLDG
ncbi:MAG TPA: ferredoxin [Isosphaeraceae bacterium]|nr:ferredoxin [Isosphaeraceae bacterium]